MKSLRKAGKKALLGLGKPPPENLVPIGESGFYTTPTDKSISPRNCTLWSDSPFCGGQPFANPLTTPPFAIGVDFTANLEGISITANPVAGWSKLPPFTVAYRFPWARNIAFVPVYVPDVNKLVKDLPPSNFDNLAGNDNDIILAVVGLTQFRYEWTNFGPNMAQWRKDRNHGPAINWGKLDSFFDGVRYPGQKYDDRGNRSYVDVSASALSAAYYNTEDASYPPYLNQPPWSSNGSVTYENVPLFNTDTLMPGDDAPFFQAKSIGTIGTIVRGRKGAIRDWFEGRAYSHYSTSNDEVPPRSDGSSSIYLRIQAFTLWWSDKLKSPNWRNPPYTEPIKPMDCCEELKEMVRKVLRQQGTFPKKIEVFDQNENAEGAQKTERSITSIIDGISLQCELANRLSKIIGIDLLPFTLPESVVEKVDEGILGEIWDFLTPDATTKIDSLMRAFKWQVLNDSAVLGGWQRKIEEEGIKPTNPDGTPQVDENGNEKPAPKRTIVLPDIGTTLEESIRLNIRTQKTLGLMFDFLVKLQIEAAGIKLTAAQTLLTAEDIQQFLDYPTYEKSSRVPVQISVPNATDSEEVKNDLKKFEEPTKAYVKFDDWTGELSLQVQLNQALTLLRQIRANL